MRVVPEDHGAETSILALGEADRVDAWGVPVLCERIITMDLAEFRTRVKELLEQEGFALAPHSALLYLIADAAIEYADFFCKKVLRDPPYKR
jgi:hypothetical protein